MLPELMTATSPSKSTLACKFAAVIKTYLFPGCVKRAAAWHRFRHWRWQAGRNPPQARRLCETRQGRGSRRRLRPSAAGPCGPASGSSSTNRCSGSFALGSVCKVMIRCKWVTCVASHAECQASLFETKRCLSSLTRKVREINPTFRAYTVGGPARETNRARRAIRAPDCAAGRGARTAHRAIPTIILRVFMRAGVPAIHKYFYRVHAPLPVIIAASTRHAKRHS